jgi:hypothetical protein
MTDASGASEMHGLDEGRSFREPLFLRLMPRRWGPSWDAANPKRAPW